MKPKKKKGRDPLDSVLVAKVRKIIQSGRDLRVTRLDLVMFNAFDANDMDIFSEIVI